MKELEKGKSSSSMQSDEWTKPELHKRRHVEWQAAKEEGQGAGWRCQLCNKWTIVVRFWGETRQRVVK